MIQLVNIVVTQLGPPFAQVLMAAGGNFEMLNGVLHVSVQSPFNQLNNDLLIPDELYRIEATEQNNGAQHNWRFMRFGGFLQVEQVAAQFARY